jgi:hypothetical protein
MPKITSAEKHEANRASRRDQIGPYARPKQKPNTRLGTPMPTKGNLNGFGRLFTPIVESCAGRPGAPCPQDRPDLPAPYTEVSKQEAVLLLNSALAAAPISHIPSPTAVIAVAEQERSTDDEVAALCDPFSKLQ